mmetsp:Transcript_40258/g.45808  ORF Transcript_40258/g.45808 Transcript_40258/m.45808 type:complete len:232 (+) Transcript_40258:80-775(+)|eukprot:CAMPEP_0194130154 /NCGR_PEP_ID=MMETSP0152-20130528/1267_1 /TAXON_ID=1049557 /ORGANISM="Thalassiothrix antarctica, Strain L6-D1" /LENGTH=231 /DNA_ID=CAMNT_0038824581 /DNA_START=51 /DNA_END=746 /DNA_ORIENTATION=+
MMTPDYDSCPAIAPFLGYMGVMLSIVLANTGAAIGTVKAGTCVMKVGIRSPELFWRNMIPIVMAGVNGIYGLIVSVILIESITRPDFNTGENKYSFYTGCAHLASGLCCGLSGLVSGICIGIAGDASVQACGEFDVNLKKSTFLLMKNATGDEVDFGDELDVILQKMASNRMCGMDSVSGEKGSNAKKAGSADKLFVTMVLIQVFAGNLALYGMIASIILSQQVFYCSGVD